MVLLYQLDVLLATRIHIATQRQLGANFQWPKAIIGRGGGGGPKGIQTQGRCHSPY